MVLVIAAALPLKNCTFMPLISLVGVDPDLDTGIGVCPVGVGVGVGVGIDVE